MTGAGIPHTAMILAAGYGKRMQPLTLATPKPLLHVGGKAMLDHVLDRLREVGVMRAVVNAGYLGDQIVAHVASCRDPAIIISREMPPLETGGGVKLALPLLGDDPIYVLNADLPWQDATIPALQRMRAAWDSARMDVLLLLMPAERTNGFSPKGDFDLSPDGHAQRHHHPPPYSHVFIGVFIVKPQLYRAMTAETFSNNVIFDQAEAANRLFACVHDGTCYHVGTPEDLAQANALLMSGRGWNKP
ncbi:MAG: nucleotidyltransferase family protein [Alphaproteobacteria bacterium]